LHRTADQLVRTILSTASGFDGGDVDLLHGHHRIENAFGDGWVGVGYSGGEDDRVVVCCVTNAKC